MEKKEILKKAAGVLLILSGAALLVWGHWSNEQFKKRNGIEATSGATATR